MFFEALTGDDELYEKTVLPQCLAMFHNCCNLNIATSGICTILRRQKHTHTIRSCSIPLKGTPVVQINLHRNLSTNLPAHIVANATLIENTRILPELSCE